MWKFLIGLGIGVYIGSFYNCKPQINNLIKILKNREPNEK